MHFKKSLISLFFLCLTSCDPIKDDFFYSIFATDKISLHRICSDNPPLFGEGRFLEIYSISKEDITTIVKRINEVPIDVGKNPTYDVAVWKATPVTKNDSIYEEPILEFVHREMLEEKNDCFDEASIKRILNEKGNYYLPLSDNLGRIKLFVLDTEKAKLFLLTSLYL
jgi:hypothetical protein